MTTLGIQWKLHAPWRLQSSGKAKRMNQTLKSVLRKLVTETKMNWLKCLPLALMRIRTRPRTDMGVSPYEAMFGLPFLVTSSYTETYEEGECSIRKYIQIIANTLEDIRKRGLYREKYLGR